MGKIKKKSESQSPKKVGNVLSKYLSTSKHVINNPRSFLATLDESNYLRKDVFYLFYLWVAGNIMWFISDIVFVYVYPFILSSINKNEFAPKVMFGEFFVAHLISLPLAVGVGIIWSLFVALVLHLWIKLFKGSGKLSSTIKITIYSFTPMLLFGWVPIIAWFVPFYMAYIMILGISHFHRVSIKKASLIIVIPVVLLIILNIIALYLAFTNGS